MWTNLIYFMLLWGFLCTTQVHGKGKMRDLDVRHVTKFGSYKVRQEKCLFIPSYGACKNHIRVYGYSIITNRCTEYVYSGCGGNPNRFATDSQCRNTCYVVPARNTVSEPDYYADDDEVTEPMPVSYTDDY
ncbi:uncharacterized protein Dyak_GE23958 [Drosophila yakuba]|uniref:BPTI/Kunitz inhibitor domain-containing protein n=2 Tax=Drosophila yakuba TaxID=7245 RepID=B4PN80_DROYA|nr:uncharacterized protein Dyak_GE23958 [Drosophila yakuba]